MGNVNQTVKAFLTLGIIAFSPTDITAERTPSQTALVTPKPAQAKRLVQIMQAANATSKSTKLVFDETAGELLYQGQVVMTGVLSGQGRGINNPSMQRVKNIGAIPDKDYKIGAPTDKFLSVMGRDAMPLRRERGTNTYGRGGFYIHEIIPGVLPGLGTRGCVGLPSHEAQEKIVSLIREYGISELEVTHEEQRPGSQEQAAIKAKTIVVSQLGT